MHDRSAMTEPVAVVAGDERPSEEETKQESRKRKAADGDVAVPRPPLYAESRFPRFCAFQCLKIREFD